MIPSLDVCWRKHMNRLKCLVAIVVVMVVAATAAHAQEIDLRKRAKQMRQNQEELQRYSWETKMTFFVNDQLRRSDTYTVRYVMGGMVEKMQISSEVAEDKIRRPDGKKLSKKELEVAREFVTDVKNQLDGYLNPLFAEKAIATSKVLKGDGTLVLLSRDVMTAGDSVEIILNETTQKAISAVDQDRHRWFAGGPRRDLRHDRVRPERTLRSITTSEWQGFKVSIVTENSNFQSDGI